ncbi:uncharacterized protein YbjT (DUF2867 family) [Arthrobacter sp. CAN_A6]|uniref:SDR family oxidoreductase n=1 Tax=Arthrobacter sp. CAN_A6 TaxID=2787721 RepID=UPI0018C94BAF
MRIVVLGASGTMGTLVADSLSSSGHTVVRAMRSSGVDAASGVGLDAAFAGADAVVDCTNFTTISARRAVRVLGGMTANVVAAAERSQVRHLVLLSIVNAADPALRRMGYYQGKAAQEWIVVEGEVPYTIVRTTQWYELTETLLSQARVGKVAFAPRMRSRPIAAASAAEVISEVAVGPPLGAREVAGPEDRELLDLVRAVAAKKGASIRIVAIPLPGATRALAGGALLPGATVERRGPTFADWLQSG